MLVGRFLMIVPMLAIAGNLARKKASAAVFGNISGQHGAFQRFAD